MTAKRKRAHEKLAAQPGVRPVRRPVTPGSDEHFDLYYVRTGRKSTQPLVLIPGGPGLASVAQYKNTRRHAAAAGFDVIMVEHRGVGLSRHDDAGNDLPPSALTIEQAVDDIAAVLDDAGVERAVVYGTSYGTYLAAGVGVRHPGRVAAMILDSPLLAHDDIDQVRAATRHVLWDGNAPDTAVLAPKVRRLVEYGVMTPAAAQVAAAVYGFGGVQLLDRQLDLLLRGRRGLWAVMGLVGHLAMEREAPYRNEADLVGLIGYRELNYGAVPDGKPLDPAVAMRESTTHPVEFEGEPFDLVAEMPTFTWPTAVLSGGRDLITPPAVAERIASLIPGAVLVTLPTAAHSILDSRERAALLIAKMVCDGRTDALGAQGDALDRIPGPSWIRATVAAIGAAATVEAKVPRVVPRLVHRAARSAERLAD